MTQQEKQILLKDLCGRVPYVTFVYVEWHETEELEICEGCEDEEEEPNIHTLISCNYYGECDLDDNLCKTIYDIKPYLRPMSSMTKEERREYDKLIAKCIYDPDAYFFDNHNSLYDWLNAHHFDVRGLIGKGLAIDCTGLNIY